MADGAKSVDAALSLNIEEDPFFAQDLEQMARAVNYQRWQFNLVAPYLKGKVLEVGGGIGNFTPQIASCAESVVSLEPNAFCYRQLVEKTRDLSNAKVYNVTAEALDQKVSPDYLTDTVICMNVLEHLQNDAAAVELFIKRLKPQGHVVLLIPAGPWAFGEVDKRLGHYRRYSKSSAAALIRDSGLTMVTMRYFNFVGIWGWWWNARVTRKVSQSDLQIRIFDSCIVPWLSRMEAWLPPCVGQSLLVVARKN